MIDELKQVVDEVGGVEGMMAVFGADSAMAQIIQHINALEPIPDDLLLRGKLEHPMAQAHFMYHGVAARGRQNELEKWVALHGLAKDIQEEGRIQANPI
jgi:hypothetical protein